MAAYRLLIVNHAVEMGGAERVLVRLLEHLDRGLFEPALACPHHGPLAGRVAELGMEVRYGYPSPRLLEIRRKSLGGRRPAVFAYPYDMARTVCGLARLIKSGGFDLVLTNSAKADIYGSAAARLAGRPVVWRLHDIVSSEAFSRLNLALFRTFASLFAARVLAVSGAVRDALVALGVDAGKVAVVYNGIDVRQPQRRKSKEEVREEWGIPARAPLAGMVGRLVDWKGPDVFLRAAAEVAKEMPEARFMLVGDAVFGERGYVDGLKELCRELGLEERVVFTGFRDDVAEIMSSLDLLVHASVLPDPLPTVLVEAMSLGLPVVAACGGGVEEIVRDGVTGLVVPAGDAHAAAAAAVDILSHPRQAREMGEAGRRRAAEVFDIASTTREIERELLAVMEGRGLCGRARRSA